MRERFELNNSSMLLSPSERPESNFGLEPISDYIRVDKQGDDCIVIVHYSDPTKNINVEISGSVQNGDFFMNGLPPHFKSSL